jgi:hypothetical protein
MKIEKKTMLKMKMKNRANYITGSFPYLSSLKRNERKEDEGGEEDEIKAEEEKPKQQYH